MRHIRAYSEQRRLGKDLDSLKFGVGGLESGSHPYGSKSLLLYKETCS